MVQSSNVILLIHETTKTNIINHALFWVWLNEHGHDIQPSCKTVNFEMPWTSTEISTARACDHDGLLPVTRQSVRLHTGHLSVLWTLLNEILKNLGFKNGQNLVWFNPHFTFFWLQLVTTLKVLHSQLLLVYHPPQLVQRCCHRGCWWPAPSARYRHPSTCAGAADKGMCGYTHTLTHMYISMIDR